MECTVDEKKDIYTMYIVCFHFVGHNTDLSNYLEDSSSVYMKINAIQSKSKSTTTDRFLNKGPFYGVSNAFPKSKKRSTCSPGRFSSAV